MILAATLAAQVALAPCTIQGVPGEARCGTHRVWEDRDAKQGRQIDLSIIVLSALEPNARPDPFFMLQGGPGDAPSFNARFYSRTFGDIRKSRDLALVDLRGTGKSAALLCQELTRPGSNGIYDADLLSVAAVRACRSRLEKTAEEVLRGLSKGRHVVIRNNGHPIGNAEACIGRMIGQFLDRGSVEGLDQRCASENPAPPFLLPSKDK